VAARNRERYGQIFKRARRHALGTAKNPKEQVLAADSGVAD